MGSTKNNNKNGIGSRFLKNTIGFKVKTKEFKNRKELIHVQENSIN
jgi:hypothetical protein